MPPVSQPFSPPLRLLLLFTLLASPSLMAQSVVHVSNASGTDNLACGGVGSPCQTIQYAADLIAVDNDTILIDTGLYELATSVSPFTPVVNLPEGKSLAILGTPSGNGTRIDGGAVRRGFLYYYGGTGCNTGSANDGIADTLNFYFKDLIVQNCKITETCGSNTYAYGGGMRLDCDTASALYVTITECSFLSNQSFDVPGSFAPGRSGSGGAIWVYGRRNASTATGTRAEVYISDCQFSGNFANHNFNGGHGGAVFLRDLDTASVTGSSFCDNYVYSASADNGDLQHDRNAGGALTVYDTWNGSPAHGYSIDNCSFVNNSALTANGNLFVNKSEGGAVFLTKGDILSALSSATLHISNSDFYGNTVETGIEHVDRNGGTLDTTGIGGNGFYPAFEVDLGNDTTICGSDTLLLDAFIPGATYLWQDGSNGSTYSVVDTSDTFSVVVTVGNCSTEDTIVINMTPFPEVALGVDTTLCPYDSLLLNAATPGATYLWMNGSIDSAIYVQDSGLVWVDVSVNGCTTSDSLVLDTVNIQQVNLGNDTNTCGLDTLTLNATAPGASYLWQDGSTNATYEVSDTSATFWVTVMVDVCEVSDTILVNNVDYPLINIGPDTTLCPYNSVLLDATTANASYEWVDGSTNATYMAQGEGLVWVAVTTSGCTSFDSLLTDTIEIQPVNIGEDTLLCPHETLLLDASGTGLTYAWNDGSTGSSVQVTTPGTYSVIIAKDGCQYGDTLTVSYVANLQNFLSVPGGACEGESVQLTVVASNVASVAWNDGSTGWSKVVTQSGQYIATANRQGCLFADTAVVTFAPTPVVNLPDSIVKCLGDSAKLDASQPGATYLWNDNTTAPSRFVSQSGYYSVTATIGECSAFDAVNLLFKPNPVLGLPDSTVLCVGDTLKLNLGNGNASYSWSHGPNDSVVAIYFPGLYIGTVNLDGCIKQDSAYVEVNPIPRFSLGQDRSFCEDTSVLLEPTLRDTSMRQLTYQWHDGSTKPQLIATDDGVHWLNVERRGCSFADTVHLTKKYPPGYMLGDDTLVCVGDTLTFGFNDSTVSFLWNDSIQSPTAAFAAPDVIHLKASNDCGSSEDSLVVSVRECECFVYLPNAVTPDGDPFNETFEMKYTCDMHNFTIRIYNRWGELVYQSLNPDFNWDMRYHGQPLPDGTYAYQLEYDAQLRSNGSRVHHQKVGTIIVFR